jgi:hypothetical protein
MPSTQHPAPLYRYILAWGLMVGGLAGFWWCRPWLGTRTFNIGQVLVLVVSWKAASLLCLPPEAWARFTLLRFLAYCVWAGMQPTQFLKGQQTTPGAPVPTVRGFLFMARDGYGGPALYLLLQYLRVAAENTRPARRLPRSQPTWTAAVVILPVGLFLHPALVNGYLVPMLCAAKIIGISEIGESANRPREYSIPARTARRDRGCGWGRSQRK